MENSICNKKTVNPSRGMTVYILIIVIKDVALNIPEEQ